MTIPLHVQLTQSLLLECASGYYEAGERFLSVRKICRLWGVSDSTAKNSINWLRQRGLIDAMPRSGYVLRPGFRPKALLLLHKEGAPALPPPATFRTRHFTFLGGAGGTQRFGMVHLHEKVLRTSLKQAAPRTEQWHANPWSSGFFEEITSRNAEYRCFFYDPKRESPKELRARVEEARLDGLVIFGRRFQQSCRDLLEELAHAKLPVLVAFDDCEHTEITSISLNNIAMGYQATREFIRAGHKRIAVFATPPKIKHFRDRVEGCRLAAEEAGGKVELTPVVFSNTSIGSLPVKIERLFANEATRPTAVFATNVGHWLKFTTLMKRKNWRVPRDLSAIICIGKEMGKQITEPMDAFVIDFYQLGRQAAENLWALSAGNLHEKTILIDVPMRRQGSVGAPRSASKRPDGAKRAARGQKPSSARRRRKASSSSA